MLTAEWVAPPRALSAIEEEEKNRASSFSYMEWDRICCQARKINLFNFLFITSRVFVSFPFFFSFLIDI